MEFRRVLFRSGAALSWQIIVMTDVAPRHPLAQCRRQLVAEDADQDFQQRFALPSEVGDLPEIDPEVECNSQHVQQALTDFSILTIERPGRFDLDLGQNLTPQVGRWSCGERVWPEG